MNYNTYRYNKNIRENYARKQKEEFQIPALPLMPVESFSEVTDALLKTIMDEATAIEFYERLASVAPDNYSRETIESIRGDEQTHLEAFGKLYVYLVGRNPQYKIIPVQFSDYREGLFLAYKGEIEAIEFYKENILATLDQLIRDTYFFAMTDEQEHAIQFSFLYNNT